MHSYREPSTAAGMRGVLIAVLVPLVLATIAGIVVLWPSGEQPTIEGVQRHDATILDIMPCEEDGGPDCREARVRVDSGPGR